MDKDEIHLILLNKLELNPEYTQRELSKELGVSLGKINYCISKLTEKGFVKLTNFKNSKNKKEYSYLLTPNGIEAKSKLTIGFLKIKMKEYELLKEEINRLRKDSQKINHKS